MDKRNSSVPNPLCIKQFSAIIIEYLFLGEIVEALPLHSTAFKDIKGPLT